MEEKKIKCAFCKNTHDKLILFSQETFKKCKNILKQRIIHNLKFKDVLLPDDLYDSGYHRQCYKCFTGLAKKYYSVTPEKPKNAKKKSSSIIVENTSIASTSIASTSSLPSNPITNTDPCIPSTSSQPSNSTVLDSNIVSDSSLASTIAEPIVIPEAGVELESVEPVSCNSE